MPPRGWRTLESLSAYYYTGPVGIFVGVLFALSLFLFSYREYEGEKADRVLGGLGGLAALGVALFPTKAPGRIPALTWWFPYVRVIHYASAFLLFAVFILFAMWLLRKSNVPKRVNRPRDKRYRDTICFWCGVAMIVLVLWAAASLVTKAPIFYTESLAIIAFAVSWLVKGEAYKPLVAAMKRIRSG